jgi:TRAP-type C4-dicarboxylate transport system substrate-binding protein
MPNTVSRLAAIWALSLACGSALAATRVIVGSTQPEDSIVGRASKVLKSKAAEYSGGTLDVQLFFGGQLGSFGAMVTQMKINVVNLIFSQPDALGEQVPIATANAWPFLFQNDEEMTKAWSGSGGKALIAEVEKRSGYRMLFPTSNEARVILANRPAKSLADLSGLKVRVPGVPIYVNEIRMLGLVPTPFDVNQVYAGMQQNAIGGVEFPLSDAVSFSMQDVSKVVVTTNHVLSPKVWFGWGKWLDQLSTGDRTALYHALQDSSAYYSTTIKSEAASYRKKFADKGVPFVETGLTRPQLEEKVAPLKTTLPEVWIWAQRLRDGATP